MSSEKQMPPVQVAVEAEAVVVPVINDSSSGLTRMYQELNLPAARLRSAATTLLLISVFFIGSPEGIFGLVSACGVLCCAAPGSLGTAYASRCTRITATIAATFALMHMMCLSTFALAVMPNMPHAFHEACQEQAKLAIPADGAFAHKEASLLPHLFLKGLAAADAEPSDEAPKAQMVAMTVATYASAASRRLQEFAPHQFDHATAPCERAERIFSQTAPTLVWLGVLMELCLFLAAVNTARAAGHLTLLARKHGANAM